MLGWTTDGLLLGTPFRIPLEAADNVFHLSLAALALAVVLAAAAKRRTPRPQAAQ